MKEIEEKFYINDIPVYYLGDDGDSFLFRLFENTEMRPNIPYYNIKIDNYLNIDNVMRNIMQHIKMIADYKQLEINIIKNN